MDNKAIGLFLIGMTVGKLLPNLPAPLDTFNAFLPFVFIILGIVVLIKG